MRYKSEISEIIKRRAAYVALFLFVYLFPQVACAQQDDTYPTETRLFHIERSKNRNLVCYDANLADGQLDTKKPLVIYWINREENMGQRKDLSAMQRKLAYGYKLISQGDDSAEVTLSAYSGRMLKIRKLGDKYVCTLMINEEPAILNSLYVKAKESNSLSVEYVELRGVSMRTGEPLVEQVANKAEK